MAKTIWRHTLSTQEQKHWEMEGMQGWRTAMTGCVEDDAREQGCTKFIIYDRSSAIIAKDAVRALPEPEEAAT